MAVLACPQCDSPNVALSQRRFWERPLRIVFIRAFRCKACARRSLLYYGPDFTPLWNQLRASAVSLRRSAKQHAARAPRPVTRR